MRQENAVVPLVSSHTHSGCTSSGLFGSYAHAYARAHADPDPRSHSYGSPHSYSCPHSHPHESPHSYANFQPHTDSNSHATLQCVRRYTVGLGWWEPNLRGVSLPHAYSHPGTD